MVELVRHHPTKGAATDMFEPKATASHLDSTHSVIRRDAICSDAIGVQRTFGGHRYWIAGREC